jgi:uncharacterized tellurite resistance protein B-like protein
MFRLMEKIKNEKRERFNNKYKKTKFRESDETDTENQVLQNGRNERKYANKEENISRDQAALGYRILMLLSVSDGDYDENEVRVILNFIRKNYSRDLNLQNENMKLVEISSDRYNDFITKCAYSFKFISDKTQKTELLRFAIDLVSADKKITREEKRIIFSLAHLWDIHVNLTSNQLGHSVLRIE